MRFSQPYAQVIADSLSSDGARLTTIEVRIHRFVLAELNTHRAFSRNSSSSRAIPIERQIERVLEDPAVPIEFGRNQAGMQAGDPLTGDRLVSAQNAWLTARDQAVRNTQVMLQMGVHKQVTNRLLEPFMWQTVIVSSTEWDNFWSQRCSPLAQPEIRMAAEAMRDAYLESEPQALADGDWHTPYIQPEETDLLPHERMRLSVARCARVSYLSHDGRRNLDADFTLYNRLVSARPPHHSPLEHVATPGQGPGNFDGFRQLRHEIAHMPEMREPYNREG